MNKKIRRKTAASGLLMAAFVLWTVLVRFAFVRPIGPMGSDVGFAALNGGFHTLTGVHLSLYVLTDLLSLVPIGTAVGFALLGLAQWIRRKSLRRVDRSIPALGVLYAAVSAVYLFFERFVVNYRPILIGGMAEASYPSSTTMLVLCVMPTAMMQLRRRIGNPLLRRWVMIAVAAYTAFMVIGRLLSGVHWITDIIGGALFSAGAVLLYDAICTATEGKC